MSTSPYHAELLAITARPTVVSITPRQLEPTDCAVVSMTRINRTGSVVTMNWNLRNIDATDPDFWHHVVNTISSSDNTNPEFSVQLDDFFTVLSPSTILAACHSDSVILSLVRSGPARVLFPDEL
jgi:hypothetical protein